MTGPATRLTTPPSWLRRPRPTARLRLTLLYGTLFTVAGAALLGFTFWLFDRGTNDGKKSSPRHRRDTASCACPMTPTACGSPAPGSSSTGSTCTGC
jgi:hypothetical protein